MARDYAKSTVTKKRSSNGLIVFAIILIVGGLLLFWFYSPKIHQFLDQRKEIDLLLSDLKTTIQQKKSKEPLKKSEQPPQQEVHFDFYTELPAMKVE